MHGVIKKLHIYLGLLNFAAIVVFGIAGLTATFDRPPEQRARERQWIVREQELIASRNLGDKELADHVYQTLKIPLSTPIPNFAVRRNQNHQLLLDFYTINGIHRVTVLESENRLRIETFRNSVWHFFDSAHSLTVGYLQPDLRVRLWAWYNEFAIWSLLAMALSGAYLWLASRPRFRWAQYSFASGCGVSSFSMSSRGDLCTSGFATCTCCSDCSASCSC